MALARDTSALQPSPGSDAPEDTGGRARSGTLSTHPGARQGVGSHPMTRRWKGGGHGGDAAWSVRRGWGQIIFRVTLAPGQLEPPSPETVLGGGEVTQLETAQADGQTSRAPVTVLSVTALGGCGGQGVRRLCLALRITRGAHCPLACAPCSQGHGSVRPGRPLASHSSVGATGGSALSSEGRLPGAWVTPARPPGAGQGGALTGCTRPSCPCSGSPGCTGSGGGSRPASAGEAGVSAGGVSAGSSHHVPRSLCRAASASRAEHPARGRALGAHMPGQGPAAPGCRLQTRSRGRAACRTTPRAPEHGVCAHPPRVGRTHSRA